MILLDERICIVVNLRRSRENLDIKQYEVAKKLNVHTSTVSGWETGKDIIPLKRLIQFANSYDISLDYLFGLIPENKEYYPIELDLNVLARNLRMLRKKNDMTQEDVAEKLHTVQSGYSHYEQGIYLIPTAFLHELTKIYKKFSIDALFGRISK